MIGCFSIFLFVAPRNLLYSTPFFCKRFIRHRYGSGGTAVSIPPKTTQIHIYSKQDNNRKKKQIQVIRNSCVKTLISCTNDERGPKKVRPLLWWIVFFCLALHFRSQNREEKNTQTWRFDDVIFYFEIRWRCFCLSLYIKHGSTISELLYINSHYYHVNAIICRRVFCLFNNTTNE